MPLFPEPHSAEWFAAVEKSNPQQAAHTKQIVTMAGSADVCSICGDKPTGDYQMAKAKLDADAVATIRLCADCLEVQKIQGEAFLPFSGQGTDHSKN